MIDDLDRRKLFNEDLQLHRDPAFHSFEVGLGHAISYAQIAVKWAFILNGGALVALPTVTAKLTTLEAAKCSAMWFVLGLICIALCCVVTYWNFLKMSAVYRNEGIRVSWELADSYYGNDENKKENTKNITELNKCIEYDNKQIGITMWLSLIFGIFSYVAFIVGSLLLLS
ncbi:hypothetical protein [Kiloniella sp. EL199]|uniref:hypothetical protein n=1 Tax=Kiloniella sp. EL199 TaxID=2107581 RepID=UPI000EA28F0A|nr:hypothetical protein [Kiloniella sp. EL199]